MIIDIHGHTVAPAEVYAYQAQLIASRNNPDLGSPKISEESIRKTTESHIKLMDQAGTDLMIISPRPYHMMHSLGPESMVRTWTKFVNDVIYQQVQMFPNRFLGMAGLPQFRDTSPKNCIDELERCVKELGFVGCIINPDPCERDGAEVPGMGDEFWYPLYEKMVELDVPALIHPASCCSPRESYTLHFINEESIAIISLLESNVFKDFPNLKIIVSHTGGAIPFHMGRFRAWRSRLGKESFDVSMRKLYFDTCNYSQEALDFAFRILGTDRCMFGTEKPGTGTVLDQTTGLMFDDLKPVIDKIEWLTEKDRHQIFTENAVKLFHLEKYTN